MNIKMKKSLSLLLSIIIVSTPISGVSAVSDFCGSSEKTGENVPGNKIHIPIDEEHFPDPAFQYFLYTIDPNQDGSFSKGELNSIEKMDCNNWHIRITCKICAEEQNL